MSGQLRRAGPFMRRPPPEGWGPPVFRWVNYGDPDIAPHLFEARCQCGWTTGVSTHGDVEGSAAGHRCVTP